VLRFVLHSTARVSPVQVAGTNQSSESAASQSGRTNHPSENERAGCKSPHPHLSEGRGEVFFLDILFHRMNVIEIFRQLSSSLDRIDHFSLCGLPRQRRSILIS
jgi:hypothetical protein